ncbi:flagellar motor protein MotB [Tuberibacillus calidus]|jgi:chemotaxis protein MotB|uniref:flagellar motor protein MotB n=1 Tax=Tuberibacillus calidus TaxID=340097 RepID=UPI000407C380|nr:flagellar motor protein MotB [Tuberibacillus calidus]
MARKSRRKKHTSHDNHERWLITYSDLITLLLVFFVVLYSMSELEKERFNALVQSLRTAFQGEAIVDRSIDPPARDIKLPEIPAQKKDKNNEKQLDQLYIRLEKYIQENHLQTQLELNNLPQGVQITLKEEILFDLGKADIKPEAIPVLKRVGGILQSVKNPISVEGHTDNNPIRYATEFHSNWDLAAARAENVAMFLINQDGIAPERIRFTSYGEFNPRVPNDTKAHQAMNRRVNIVVLRDKPVTK